MAAMAVLCMTSLLARKNVDNIGHLSAISQRGYGRAYVQGQKFVSFSGRGKSGPNFSRRLQPAKRKKSDRKNLRRHSGFAQADLTTDTAKGVYEDKAGSAPARVVLLCPVCYEPLKRTGPLGFDRVSLRAVSCTCLRCQRPVPIREDGILDLTIEGETDVYKEPRVWGTSTFEKPSMAYAYERGYRQQFGPVGFPGVQEELKMASGYLEAAHGGQLLDVSCASGLFARLFAKSKLYSTVIASDFSSSMLSEARGFIEADSDLNAIDIPLVRADVARLPFQTGSLSGVHAGAAIHCWPIPSLGVAEISRVLRPGGVFVGTTFLAPTFPFADDVLKPLWKAIFQTKVPFLGVSIEPIKAWEKEELESLILSCGFVNFKCVVIRQFIMFTASKPSLSD